MDQSHHPGHSTHHATPHINVEEPSSRFGGIGGMLDNFIKQSERVLNVTHKPDRFEFKKIALSTAIGMGVVGIIGYVIAMIAYFGRRGL